MQKEAGRGGGIAAAKGSDEQKAKESGHGHDGATVPEGAVAKTTGKEGFDGFHRQSV